MGEAGLRFKSTMNIFFFIFATVGSLAQKNFVREGREIEKLRSNTGVNNPYMERYMQRKHCSLLYQILYMCDSAILSGK